VKKYNKAMKRGKRKKEKSSFSSFLFLPSFLRIKAKTIGRERGEKWVHPYEFTKFSLNF
jgi:hypothetical protein